MAVDLAPLEGLVVAWSALVGHAGDAVALQIVKPPSGFHLRKKKQLKIF